jgi:outer membrane immunogenic protein
MRRSIFALIAALGFAGSASAADLPTKAPALAAPVADYNWTGIYVGGSLGGAWARGDTWTFPFAPGLIAPGAKAQSGVGTFHVGAQWQWQHLVLGVEGNIYQYFDLNAVSVCPNGNICQLSALRSWTVGPRLGWAQNNWLFYGTGGYAETELESPVFLVANNRFSDGGYGTHGGWFAGGGVEYAVVSNAIVGVEYTHIRADSKQQASPPILRDDRVVGMDIDTVRARLSIKFNPF